MGATFWTTSIDWVLNANILQALSEAEISNDAFNRSDDNHVTTLLQACVDYGFTTDVVAVINHVGVKRGMQLFRSCKNVPDYLLNNVTSAFTGI